MDDIKKKPYRTKLKDIPRFFDFCRQVRTIIQYYRFDIVNVMMAIIPKCFSGCFTFVADAQV